MPSLLHRDSLLRSPTAWTASFGSWLLVAFFIWGRDLIMIGPSAPGLAGSRILLFAESMALWALFSPFIVAISQALPLGPGKYWRAGILHAVTAFGLSVLDVIIDALVVTWLGEPKMPLMQRFYDQVYINHFSYAAVAAVGYAAVYARDATASRIHAAQLESQLADARFDALVRRLQPHFLFNALNSLAALIKRSETSKALDAVVAIGNLLRTVLQTHGEARVSLRQEVAWAEEYLTIERLRFGDRLQTQLTLSPAAEHALVPALLLQPLVENAVRHGIERSGGRGVISISAAARPAEIVITVLNESCLADTGSEAEHGFGIGLEATRKRLRHLYGEDRFELAISSDARRTAVTIRIPYEEVTTSRTGDLT